MAEQHTHIVLNCINFSVAHIQTCPFNITGNIYLTLHMRLYCIVLQQHMSCIELCGAI